MCALAKIKASLLLLSCRPPSVSRAWVYCADTQGSELLAIFDVTRDKDDARRAENYFTSACKLDPSTAEEADEGRQQAIAKRRSRRQRAASSAAERRRSVVDGVSAAAASAPVTNHQVP